ncbi:MAG: NfeD family protein [Planctomycetota bacterium]
MTHAMTIPARDRTTRRTPMWRVWTRIASVLALALFVATDPSAGQEASPTPQGPTAVAASAQIDNLVVITVEGAIDAVTSKSFQRRFKQAIEGGADGIVVEIDSPGGEVGAVLEITDLIKSASVPTIAWINNDAYSGGAIIAIACDEIVLATGATMGDAAPVMAGPMGLQNLSETERAKILSPLLAEVVDSAAMNGYDEVLITSLVMVNVETWLVEHKQTGKRYFLTEREYRALFDNEPPRATPLVQSGGVDLSTLAPPPTATGPSRFPDSAVPSSPRTPDPSNNQPAPTTLPDDAPPILEALADVADESTIAAASVSIATPSTRPDFAAESASDYTFIQYATDGNTLLTLKESGLRALGFTRYPNTIDSDQELEQYVGAKKLVRLDQSWSEDFVAFATQGMSGLLFRGAMIVVFLLGLFVEMAMPGVGVAGFIALIALAGLIVPPMMIDASSWWTLVAILGGVLLIMLEIFVIPGLGIPGILGLLALLAGLIGTFSTAGELFPGAGPGNDGRLGWAVATVFLSLFGAGVGCYFVSKYSRSIPIARSLTLNTTLATYDTSEPTGMLAAMGDTTSPHPVDIGDEGVATTDIRPEGEAEFAGELHDVFTPSGWIGRNARVRVSGFEGNKILVEKMDADPPEAPKTPHENYGSYG